MDNNVLTALIGSASSGLVAITALVLNYRGFSSIDSRFAAFESRFVSFESRIDNRFTALENKFDRRFDSMQADMKDLNKAMIALESDVALLKDKIGV